MSDKFGKTRTIAIGDSFSQTALSGLHDTFMKGLSKMRTDCTYRQSEIPKLISQLGDSLYSSDLTAFTDRFPRKWQIAVISARYGNEIAQLWEQVIADRVFTSCQGEIKYVVGNPMGLLSSWPISTFYR